jgi:hypothetical protein
MIERRVGVLQVTGDAVEIEAGGARHELAGYPPPISREHQPPSLTTAVVTPDGRQVAVAGVCHGNSGSDPRVPSCARGFVRLYRVADGAHVRDLAVPWVREIDDERRLLAMAFDERADLLAVVVHAAWSDCSFGGTSVELVVYRLADGAWIAHRTLARNEAADTLVAGRLEVTPGEVRVRARLAPATPRVWIVRLARSAARAPVSAR